MKYLLIAALFLAGCSTGVSTHDAGPGQPELSVCSGGYCIDVVSVHLKDGTPCAVAVGSYKGGISCNWKSEKAQ